MLQLLSPRAWKMIRVITQEENLLLLFYEFQKSLLTMFLKLDFYFTLVPGNVNHLSWKNMTLLFPLTTATFAKSGMINGHAALLNI